jgi:magnesium transporter
MIAFLWYQDLHLSYIVAGAMMINLTTAGVAGAYLPLFLEKINVDPALAGSVLLTTITDSIGFFAFLGLAHVFYL